MRGSDVGHTEKRNGGVSFPRDDGSDPRRQVDKSYETVSFRFAPADRPSAPDVSGRYRHAGAFVQVTLGETGPAPPFDHAFDHAHALIARSRAARCELELEPRARVGPTPFVGTPPPPGRPGWVARVSGV